MNVNYQTRDGDTIDQICHQFYGATSGIVETVLEANRGLEDQPEILPAGIELILPEINVAENRTSNLIRLWD